MIPDPPPPPPPPAPAMSGQSRPSPPKSKSELFELIDRLQSARLDDQRCALPPTLNKADGDAAEDPVVASKNSSRNLLRRVLQEPPPYPMVVLPKDGGWWVDPPPKNMPNENKELQRSRKREAKRAMAAAAADPEDSFEAEETARSYRSHFLGCEHYNFCAIDDNLGPVVLSLRTYSEQERLNYMTLKAKLEIQFD